MNNNLNTNVSALRNSNLYIRNFFYKNVPDVSYLFAWNHKAEVMEKEASFIESGGEWITYIPQVDIIRK